MRAKECFTLVELMVIVLIIRAVATVAIPRISQASADAKANSCAINIDLINAQIELYYKNDLFGKKRTIATYKRLGSLNLQIPCFFPLKHEVFCADGI